MMIILVGPGMLSDGWFPLSENSVSTNVLSGGLAVGTALASVGQTQVIVGPVQESFFL